MVSQLGTFLALLFVIDCQLSFVGPQPFFSWTFAVMHVRRSVRKSALIRRYNAYTANAEDILFTEVSSIFAA